jgi:hypothetical protein
MHGVTVLAYSLFTWLQIFNVRMLHSVQTESRTHQCAIQYVRGALPQEVKRQGREADHSPPSSAEVRNGGGTTPLPNMSSWHSVQLIKHMNGNF